MRILASAKLLTCEKSGSINLPEPHTTCDPLVFSYKGIKRLTSASQRFPWPHFSQLLFAARTNTTRLAQGKPARTGNNAGTWQPCSQDQLPQIFLPFFKPFLQTHVTVNKGLQGSGEP